jgi:hypothetical protein
VVITLYWTGHPRRVQLEGNGKELLFRRYSLPEGDSYASKESLIIEICLAGILIFGSTVPQRTLDFHAVMIQSVWDQEGKKPLSSHHTFPSFESGCGD